MSFRNFRHSLSRALTQCASFHLCLGDLLPYEIRLHVRTAYFSRLGSDSTALMRAV